MKTVLSACLLLIGLTACDVREPQSSSSSPATADIKQPAPAPEAKKDYSEEAYYFAREACLKMLKAPATAKFSNPYGDEHTGWKHDGFEQWECFGSVDAQNSFGAMLRQDWEAVVRKDGDTLSIVYLRLGKEVAGERPEMRRAPPPQPTPEQLAAWQAGAVARKTSSQVATFKFHEARAKAGDSSSQYRLGQLYLAGDGVAADSVEARRWFRLAAAQGHAEAAAAMAKISTSKSP